MMEYIYASCTFTVSGTKKGYEVSITTVRNKNLLAHLNERDAAHIAMHFNDHLPMKLTAGPVVMPVSVTKEMVWQAIEFTQALLKGGDSSVAQGQSMASSGKTGTVSEKTFWEMGAKLGEDLLKEAIRPRKPDIKVEKPERKQLPKGKKK